MKYPPLMGTIDGAHWSLYLGNIKGEPYLDCATYRHPLGITSLWRHKAELETWIRNGKIMRANLAASIMVSPKDLDRVPAVIQRWKTQFYDKYGIIPRKTIYIQLIKTTEWSTVLHVKFHDS